MRPILAFVTIISLSGCFHVKNQLYNPASDIQGAGSGEKSIVRVLPDDDVIDQDCTPSGHACLAFLEFDEMGEMWDPAQLEKAIALIRRAKQLSPHPIVVTFTHGWKNNANDKPGRVNNNVLGFEGVLDFLEHPPIPHRFADSPIVGIYIGWRGNLVSQYWPVRQQLSYFNREGAAIRIPGASLTSALIRIMKETHGDQLGPIAIMVGHSFGGLVMERALSQAMTDFVLRGGNKLDGADGAWADLVVFVNSAAAASEGKQMLDLLKNPPLQPIQAFSSAGQQPPQQSLDKPEQPPAKLRMQYSVTAQSVQGDRLSSPSLVRTAQRPLFLSISSLGDTATRFGLVIGHGPSAIGRQLTGSWRTYSNPDIPSVPLQRSYYLSTTAHMEVLQSHLIVEDKPQLLKQCGPLFNPTPVKLTTGQRYFICEKPDRWNDTPYWAMEMPATIVPDHNGIFNLNFIYLLEQFLPSENEMRDPNLMPSLRLQ